MSGFLCLRRSDRKLFEVIYWTKVFVLAIFPCRFMPVLVATMFMVAWVRKLESISSSKHAEITHQRLPTPFPGGLLSIPDRKNPLDISSRTV